MTENYAEAGFVVSALPAYVQENRDLISKNIALGAPTLGRISIQQGIKGTMPLHFLENESTWQNGKGCSFNPDGSTTLTDRNIVTGLIKIDRELCPDDLLGKWPEYDVRIPATEREHLPFEAYIVADIVNDIEEKLEEAIWQADTTSNVHYLNKFDGLLKIIAAEQTSIKLTIAQGTTAIAAVRQIISSLPKKVLKKGAALFVSPEFFTALGFELVDANLFHFAPSESLDEFIFPGSKVRILNTDGLSGTANIVATWAPNLFYGTDTVNGQRLMKVAYDDIKESFALKVRFNAGTQVAFPDWVVLATLA